MDTIYATNLNTISLHGEDGYEYDIYRSDIVNVYQVDDTIYLLCHDDPTGYPVVTNARSLRLLDDYSNNTFVYYQDGCYGLRLKDSNHCIHIKVWEVSNVKLGYDFSTISLHQGTVSFQVKTNWLTRLLQEQVHGCV